MYLEVTGPHVSKVAWCSPDRQGKFSGKGRSHLDRAIFATESPFQFHCQSRGLGGPGSASSESVEKQRRHGGTGLAVHNTDSQALGQLEWAWGKGRQPTLPTLNPLENCSWEGRQPTLPTLNLSGELQVGGSAADPADFKSSGAFGGQGRRPTLPALPAGRGGDGGWPAHS